MAVKGTEFRYFLGYPRSFAGVVAARAGCLLGCLPLALVPVSLAVFYFCRFRETFHIGPLIAFLLSVLLTWLFSGGMLAAFQRPSVDPRFEPKLRHCVRWEGGRFLARQWRRLDGLAAGNGLRQLSEFGFERAKRGQPDGWHDPTPAAETAHGLATLIRASPWPGDADILSDLEFLEDALIRAARLGHRFHFELNF